jgi:hypothetical protein
MSKFVIFVVLLSLLSASTPKKFKGDEKPDWAKKDIRDFTDADMERLLEQWEVSRKDKCGKKSTVAGCRKTTNRSKKMSCPNICAPCLRLT